MAISVYNILITGDATRKFDFLSCVPWFFRGSVTIETSVLQDTYWGVESTEKEEIAISIPLLRSRLHDTVSSIC